MAILLALASAAVVGSADFFGGFATRRGRVFAVVAWSHLFGVAATAAIGPVVGGSPTAADLWWGAASGVSGAAGILSLYSGFAAARVGVVAPTSAVVAAVFPALFGIVEGERPSLLALAGIALGIGAVLLISRAADGSGLSLTGLLYGIGAGLGFGGLFILLSRAQDGSGIWPLGPGRLAGFVVIALAAAIWGRDLRPVRSSWPPLLVAGFLAVLGNGLFLLASQRGLLSVVAVLTSLYPVATVAWARAIFKEVLAPSQLLGLALALLAVAVIATG